MTRDGEPPEDDGTETPRETDDATPTEKNDNVIAFPGARVRSVPAPGEPTEATAAPPDERSPEEPGMTLDAFERAVRSAVREKLGDSPDRPQGADELVAQVFSALTGKDAKTALSEVRQRLSEPLMPDGDGREGDVIDLGAVREARQRASLESAQKIGGALKQTFSEFIANLAQKQGISGEITLDAQFFKQHGTSLLGNLFQGLAAALIQQGAPKPAPAPSPFAPPPPEPPTSDETPAEATSSAPPEPPRPSQVHVKLDFGSILAGLFRRRETPPPEPPPESEP